METMDMEYEIISRPQNFDDFIGQDHLKKNLSIFIEAAKIRKRSLDHVLFYGPPGLGKTTLAHIIARSLDVNMHLLSGPSISKVGDLAAILTNMKPKDVLFIDEIHRLNISIEESLYTAMEDFRLDIIIGEGVAAKTIRIDLAEFTLIGATTRTGLISGPMRTRFGINIGLEFYNKAELGILVDRCMKKQNIGISKQASISIAQRARGTPRIAIHLSKRIADFALLSKMSTIDQALVEHATEQMGIDAYGLDINDIKYLKFILEYHNGGPVGINTIAAGLSDDIGSVESIIEPFLIQDGFINRTTRGRMLTPKAIDHIKQQS